MAAAKIAITLDRRLLRMVDQWVRQGQYPNRSRGTRLAEELDKLDVRSERALADERFAGEPWSES